MRSKAGKPRKPTGTAVLEPPVPWWGTGDAPEVRWPGVTIAIPSIWVEVRERWESPDGSYWFDTDAADFAAEFFPTCLQHHIGEWNGKPFNLLPYQAFLVRALFGWKRVADGLRRFRKVFLAVPKGSGKSQFGAGLGLFLAFFDGEAGAEVYAVAADRGQANIVFGTAKVMVLRNDTWSGLFEVFRDSIKKTGSTEYFQVLSSDASTKHGFRPHGIIFDEFHAQPDRDLFETLFRGMGKRQQPVLVMITTAGDDDESVCFEEWDYARRVVQGHVTDDGYLPIIFEARADEDWTSEAVLRRVNPGYGITMKAEYFTSEVAAALVEPRKRNSFIQLHTNRWVNQAVSWIPIEWWDACKALLDEMVLKGLQCSAGLDMGLKYDLTAFVVAFRELIPSLTDTIDVRAGDDGKVETRPVMLNYRLTLIPYFWIPEDTMHQREKEDGVPYSLWRERNLVTATDGAATDYSRVYRDITTKILPRFPLLKQGIVGYDPAFATDLAQELRDRAGLNMVEVLQNYVHLSEPAHIFEALVKSKRLQHDGNSVLRDHVGNVAVKKDDAGRIRPVKPKKSSTKRIDSVVATCMAIKTLMLMAQPTEPRYQSYIFGTTR